MSSEPVLHNLTFLKWPENVVRLFGTVNKAISLKVKKNNYKFVLSIYLIFILILFLEFLGLK